VGLIAGPFHLVGQPLEDQYQQGLAVALGPRVLAQERGLARAPRVQVVGLALARVPRLLAWHAIYAHIWRILPYDPFHPRLPI
jgi:hypothetical protein